MPFANQRGFLKDAESKTTRSLRGMRPLTTDNSSRLPSGSLSPRRGTGLPLSRAGQLDRAQPGLTAQRWVSKCKG